ncbi:MAG: response regulator transcription factor [Bacteroidota bacterium]|nr:response regulator transcription factor [Bacteroidota bacterium]
MKVLLIEDDANLAFMLIDGLESEGFEVLHLNKGEEALKAFERFSPDIILLDVNLKGVLNGFEVGRTVRQSSNIPIIFTTARTQYEDLQQGFGIGNVDYLKKPYSIRELSLRINALLSRPGNQPAIERNSQHTDKKIGKYLFNPVEHCLTIDQETIHLPKNECLVLNLLVDKQGKVVQRNDILNAVWGEKEGFMRESSLNNILSSLRSKLSSDSQVVIQSIPKVGCKLIILEQ